MRYFFDFWIILIILTSSGLVRFFWHNAKKTGQGKNFFLWLFFSLSLIVLLLTFYGSFVEPKIITSKEYPIKFGQTIQNENIRLIVLTDLHLGNYKSAFFLNRIVKKVIKLQPDIVILGGDYVDGKINSTELLFPLSKISSLFPTFAVMGNHEYNQGFFADPKFQDLSANTRTFFFENNITVLDNNCQVVTVKNQKINIAGIIDFWTGKANFLTAYEKCDPRQKTVLISHNPEIVLLPLEKKFDLVISGHTHGGQFRLPFWGSLAKIPTKLGQKYDRGLFNFSNLQLFISQGLGESGARARLFVPPEISVLNIDL